MYCKILKLWICGAVVERTTRNYPWVHGFSSSLPLLHPIAQCCDYKLVPSKGFKVLNFPKQIAPSWGKAS